MGDDITNKIFDRTEKIKQINGLIDELQNEIKSLDAEGEEIVIEILKNIDQIKIKKVSQFINKIPD